MNEVSTPVRFSPLGILLQPGQEFARLVAAPRFVAPVLALVVGTMLVALAYYSRLDYAWFRDTLVAGNPLVAHYAGRSAVTLDRGTLMLPGVLSASMATLLAWFATGVYVRFVAAALRRPFTFRDALALTAWASLPCVVALLPAAVNLALHPDGRLAPDQVDPATLAMLFGVPGDTLLGALCRQVSLFNVWAWGLQVVGLHEMLRVRWWKAAVIVAVPLLLVLAFQVASLSATLG